MFTKNSYNWENPLLIVQIIQYARSSSDSYGLLLRGHWIMSICPRSSFFRAGSSFLAMSLLLVLLHQQLGEVQDLVRQCVAHPLLLLADLVDFRPPPAELPEHVFLLYVVVDDLVDLLVLFLVLLPLFVPHGGYRLADARHLMYQPEERRAADAEQENGYRDRSEVPDES